MLVFLTTGAVALAIWLAFVWGLRRPRDTPAIRVRGRDVTEPALIVSAIVAWALVLLAGNGPTGPALATFALGLVVLFGVLALARAVSLRRQQRRLLEAHEAFVSDASHQLRTPLAALRLRLEDLEARLGDTPLASTTRAASFEAQRLADLTSGLLTLTADPPPIERVDLGELAHAAAAATMGIAQARDVRLEVHLDRAATVRAGRLDEALAELVENAVRYAPPATAVTIAVRDARVEVRDAGPGLAPGEERRVFERFFRGSAAGAAPEGVGLGLAITRQIARQAGGDVTLANRPDGRGAIAVLDLTAAGETS